MEASGNNKYLPPQSIDAEQALLGACLLDQEALNNALEYIRAEDFYREDHRLIFACMEKLTAEGAPCDLITVVDALQLSNNLNGAGDIAYIASLANSLPATSSAVYYAKIIAEKSMLRSLITVGKQINEESYFAFNDADAVLENAEKSIFDISERKIKKSFHHIGPIAVEVMEQIGKIKASDGITGIPTFRDLDNLLTGLKKSDLIILAARPGMGKTSMALNIAQNAACKHGYTVAIFSLEMPKEQLVQRMLCSAAGVDQGKARSGKISSEEMSLLSKNIGPLAKAEIYIDDSAGISVMEMRSKCRKLKMEKKALDLVVIDYLQLMQSTAKRQENRQQ
ncbi:MAG: replicative DNA helicase, partial [Clostridiales bacterium]